MEKSFVDGGDKSGIQKVDNSGESGIIESRKADIIDGKNVVGEWLPHSKFDSEIDDIIDYQGYNGKPTIIYDCKEFDKYVENDHFLAERTFCADIKEKLIEYDNQLKALNGESYFYVNCGVGGAQYGQRMYCAADYTKGTIGYNKFEHEIKQYAWGDKFDYSKTNWMTLDPSAKIINIPNGANKRECHEYVSNLYCEEYKNFCLSKDLEIRKRYEEYEKGMGEVRRLNGSSKSSDWDKADNIADKLNTNYPDVRKFQIELDNIADNKDVGVMAAEIGYDVINAQGHGTTDSYSVVLNRTKLIIFGGDDYVYK